MIPTSVKMKMFFEVFFQVFLFATTAGSQQCKEDETILKDWKGSCVCVSPSPSLCCIHYITVFFIIDPIPMLFQGGNVCLFIKAQF